MSAPRPVLPASLSTSGFRDGLGTRSLAFDRECGIALERLVVRPELAAFERPLRDRADRLAAFDDERFARIRSVEYAREPGTVTVTSEFVAGNRVADLIEDSAERPRDENTPPSVDAALGFLLQALPALAALHAARLTHGAVAPERIVLTPAGQLVFLDSIFAEALQRLHLSRQRLWPEFGLAVPASAGHPRMDAALDVSQCALAALAITVGRRLRAADFPSGLPALLGEALEIAQLRGRASFASALQRFFSRALPLPARRPYASADDAAAAVQQIARDEMGLESCAAALIDLAREPIEPVVEFRMPDAMPTSAPEVPAPAVVPEPSPAMAQVTKVSERDKPAARAESKATTEREARVAIAPPAVAAPPVVVPAPVVAAPPVVVPPPVVAAPPVVVPPPVVATPPVVVPPPVVATPPVVVPPPVVVEPPAPPAAKRKRQRGSKAHRDNLRSTEVPPVNATIAPPPAPAAKVTVPESPKVTVPEPLAPPPAPPAKVTVPESPKVTVPESPSPRLVPVQPPPPPAPPVPMPTFERLPDHLWIPPQTAVPLAPVAAPPVAAAPPPGPAPLRLKTEPPAGFVPPPPARTRAPLYADAAVERQPLTVPRQERRSTAHWKAAAAVLAVIAIGVAAGRSYLPERLPEMIKAPAPKAEVAPAPAPPPEKTGTLVIETQPAGARVLVDGKPAGETPLKIDAVPVGHHIVTLTTSSSTVKRSVRVEAGKTASIDVAVYSGWLAIFAPIVLEVAEGGKSLGTTEHGRLMLPPGRHALTLSNRELGYSAVHKVDIDPGEERVLTVEPRGEININAQPWAEVFIDGARAGETPIANLRVPLGTREIVFKHPEFGERRVTTVVTAATPATVSIDFSK